MCSCYQDEIKTIPSTLTTALHLTLHPFSDVRGESCLGNRKNKLQFINGVPPTRHQLENVKYLHTPHSTQFLNLIVRSDRWRGREGCWATLAPHPAQVWPLATGHRTLDTASLMSHIPGRRPVEFWCVTPGQSAVVRANGPGTII